MSNVARFLAYSEKHRLSIDRLATRIIVNYLNKRGYDVHEARDSDPTEKSRASTASTASSVSSVVASLREPKHGQTPLHLAARKRDLPVMQALLKTEGIENFINHQDNNGNTALHFAAAASKHEESSTMVQLLLEAASKHEESSTMVQLLLEAGANVDVMNHKSLVPSAVHMLTLTKDEPRIVCMLLDCGANPSARVDESTLLHIAARRGFPKVAYHLVRNGASPSARNQNGLMCVEVASNCVRYAMFEGISSTQPYTIVWTEAEKIVYSFSSLPRTCEKGKLGKLLPLRSFVLQEMLGRTGSFKHYTNSTLSIEGRRFVKAIPLLSMSSDHTYAHDVINQHNALVFTHDDTITIDRQIATCTLLK
ncbi:hypothetical protein ABG067_001000 [Albugo candida]